MITDVGADSRVADETIWKQLRSARALAERSNKELIIELKTKVNVAFAIIGGLAVALVGEIISRLK